MARRRALVSWIGYADLMGLATDLPPAKQKKILASIGRELPKQPSVGPIRTLVENETFDEIHLLGDRETWVHQEFTKWLGGKTQVHAVKIEKPTDYPSIFRAADGVLSKILSGPTKRPTALCIHLSPGTPAMTAVWVLLGKSRYPATFYQTHNGRAWQTEIPFDLVVDYVPELLRTPDASLQHLATRSPQEVEGFEAIIGDSQAIRLAVGRAQKAAIRDVPVLILGETGTGKDMFAQAIHQASHRSKKPFIAINCAAMPKDLLDSELFGHEKGAFTGADKMRIGAFEQANGGTLFLDEIGECAPEMQAKLLRALQPPPGQGPCHRIFRRVGAKVDRASDVRVLAATNRDLLSAIRQNKFREDLYYRLAIITLKLPPLRERRTDIPQLVRFLLNQINTQFASTEPGYQNKSLAKSSLAFIKRHAWRGNVRQLHGALVQAAVMCDGDVIKSGDLMAATAEQEAEEAKDLLNEPLGNGFSIDEHLDGIHRHYLERALTEADGVLAQATRLLGLNNFQTLDKRLARLVIDKARWKK